MGKAWVEPTTFYPATLVFRNYHKTQKIIKSISKLPIILLKSKFLNLTQAVAKKDLNLRIPKTEAVKPETRKQFENGEVVVVHMALFFWHDQTETRRDKKISKQEIVKYKNNIVIPYDITGVPCWGGNQDWGLFKSRRMVHHKTSIGRETAGHLVKFSTEDTSQITDLRVGATPNVTPLGPGPLVPEHRMKADKKKHHGAWSMMDPATMNGGASAAVVRKNPSFVISYLHRLSSSPIGLLEASSQQYMQLHV